MDIEHKIDYETGFMSQQQYNGKMKVNINGGFYEGIQIVGIDVKSVLSCEI